MSAELAFSVTPVSVEINEKKMLQAGRTGHRACCPHVQPSLKRRLSPCLTKVLPTSSCCSVPYGFQTHLHGQRIWETPWPLLHGWASLPPPPLGSEMKGELLKVLGLRAQQQQTQLCCCEYRQKILFIELALEKKKNTPIKFRGGIFIWEVNPTCAWFWKRQPGGWLVSPKILCKNHNLTFAVCAIYRPAAY